MINVLVVDDEENILWLLKEGISSNTVNVFTANSSDSAIAYLNRQQIDVCIVDIFLEDENGLNLIDEWRKRYPDTDFIVITAQNTSSNIIEAMSIGAIDFFPKPFNVEEVKLRILDIVSKKEKKIHSQDNLIYDYQTLSRKMLEVYKVVGKVARTNINVLITGETGTGKEIIANMIHNKSNRKDKPFIAVNVASIPHDLIESELFGYVKGAFTGAVSDKSGKFEEANGGTIFLDEIGEMELGLQAKILRILQDRELFRLGSNKKIKLNVRIIAATNKDLEQMVKEGAFREDLFYRLNVVDIKLPPLRERREDIPILVEYFLKKYAHIKGVEISISDLVMDILKKYNWPGNVRELENVIQYSIVQSSQDTITVYDLPERFQNLECNVNEDSLKDKLYNLSLQLIDSANVSGSFDAYNDYMKIVEVPLIIAALYKTNGNKSHAAKILGINRNTLRSKIKELGIDDE
ncbi:MAG: sigma-54 dependent transcriptional regulator [Calditerrivibrio sp.]|nr:sigma-54 dependent transcriptional regulator [Calditerrivibrio sp.]MCA1932845.1 sigma-54 dependent transcriptional regulator [Calditerrivibrio sp.]